MDKVKELAFFPGMDLPTNRKVEVFRYVLKNFKLLYNVLAMNEFAGQLEKWNKESDLSIPSYKVIPNVS